MDVTVTAVELQPADNAVQAALAAFIASVKEAVEAFLANLVAMVQGLIGIAPLD